MNPITFSFFLLFLSFTLSIAKKDDDTKNIPFNIDDACKDSTAREKCTSVLRSLGGDKPKVKAGKLSDKVVKEALSEFGKVSTKARKEMREDKAKVEVKKALSHCVKFYLDMNDELRGLMAVGLKSSNYGSTVDNFSKMAQNYPRLCEEELMKAGTSGEKLGMYGNYKEVEDLGNVVSVVTRYVSANSSQKPAGSDENAGNEEKN